jgi:hypothetical protein
MSVDSWFGLFFEEWVMIRPNMDKEQPNNALHPSLDPARLALPLQVVCVKCG